MCFIAPRRLIIIRQIIRQGASGRAATCPDGDQLLQLESSQHTWHSREEPAVDVAYNARAATEAAAFLTSLTAGKQGIAATSGATSRGQQQLHRLLLLAPLAKVASSVGAAPSQSQALLAQPLAEGPGGFFLPLLAHAVTLAGSMHPCSIRHPAGPIQLWARPTGPRLAEAGTCTGGAARAREP